MFQRYGYGIIAMICLLGPLHSMCADNKPQPLRLAVAGITHAHIAFIFGRKDKGDVAIVGIYETDTALIHRVAKRYNLDPTIFYSNLNDMLDRVKPQAVVAFGSIYEHMMVVEACAPRGIHVMVEKPLATNVAHAERMQQLAAKYHIMILTDYETSWYPTTAKTYQLLNDSNYVGAVRKVIIHDGHEGPKAIGVNKEFFNWLTDPVQNGGGAIIDFGCYGANLMTYLMHGETPLSVTAVTQHFQPLVYPKVDDEATIIITYPSAQCIVQASWNWPFSRKDMEVYGETGYLIAVNKTDLRMRNKATNPIETKRAILADEVAVYKDPFTYFADAIAGKITVPESGLYSLSNNVTVVRILSAARESASSGKAITIKDK